MRKTLALFAAVLISFGMAACDEENPDLRPEPDRKDVALVSAEGEAHPKIQARLDHLSDRLSKAFERVTRLTFVADEARDKANMLIEQVNCLAATADVDEGTCVETP